MIQFCPRRALETKVGVLRFWWWKGLRWFYFTSPQPIRPNETSDFTIEDVMLWPGMRLSLRSQCKRCSAGRLHNSLPYGSRSSHSCSTRRSLRRSYVTCTSWLRTHILHHDVPRISTIFISLCLNPLGQTKLPIVISLSTMLCFGRVCASPCALNVSAALQGAYNCTHCTII